MKSVNEIDLQIFLLCFWLLGSSIPIAIRWSDYMLECPSGFKHKVYYCTYYIVSPRELVSDFSERVCDCRFVLYDCYYGFIL